jgi:solute carrier family 25 (mitochondrial folate transporter), member 32
MPRVYPSIHGKATDITLSPSLVETVAGFTAGVVATLVVHPFDVLKTRLQLETGRSQWGGSFRILRQVVRDEGRYTALYRGLMPNMLGNSVSWALYFLWCVASNLFFMSNTDSKRYRNAKDLFQAWKGPDAKLTSLDYFLSSGAAGIVKS